MELVRIAKLHKQKAYQYILKDKFLEASVEFENAGNTLQQVDEDQAAANFMEAVKWMEKYDEKLTDNIILLLQKAENMYIINGNFKEAGNTCKKLAKCMLSIKLHEEAFGIYKRANKYYKLADVEDTSYLSDIRNVYITLENYTEVYNYSLFLWENAKCKKDNANNYKMDMYISGLKCNKFVDMKIIGEYGRLVKGISDTIKSDAATYDKVNMMEFIIKEFYRVDIIFSGARTREYDMSSLSDIDIHSSLLAKWHCKVLREMVM